MSIRKDIEARFTEDWAGIDLLSKVRVIATERDLDEITVPTVLIRQKTIDRTPSAPLSHRDIGLLLTVISHHLDLDRAGDSLDDLVPAVLDYLDPGFIHGEASCVGYGQRLAYDIPLTVITTKE